MNQTEKVFLTELLDLVKVLNDTESKPNIQEKLININEKYKEVKCKDNIWAILDDMCSDIIQIYFVLLEYLYAATKDEQVLKKQLEILTKGIREEKINLFYALFYKWQIISRNFNNFESKLLFIERSNLHIELLPRMRKFLELDIPVIEKNNRNKDRIVVTVTQLLGIKHGPTRNALDYCYTLQEKLHKEVFLLVASEAPSEVKRECETYGLGYGYFEHIEAYDGYFSLEYQDTKLRGFQCRINEENADKIREIILSIYEWKPYLIYNIGSENLIADICGSFTQEVSIPCGFVYPITEAEYHILPRKIEKGDSEILNYISKRKHQVIESIFVYKLEEPIKIYKKEDFGLGESSFVIAVVGTRLEQEVNDDFIWVLNEILKADQSIIITFIGVFDNFEEKKKNVNFDDRIKFLGMQNDLRGVFNVADLYLNPPRKGGGTSSVEAMAEGIPVISLGNCDVAYTCGEDFICDSLKDIPELVLRYMQDRTFYENQSRKAKLQAARLINTEEVLQEILEYIEE